ncbi:MAG TPA: nickel-responsive transcriptional regulator NikR [Acidobacteriota bacterium]|jgi:CopG family nickel-responsive transcriptional regulator|nr:nickel-responsive transcriptional regulator NikR [Acidobacteriota bacterium]
MAIISLSIPDELLNQLDKILGEEWYASRSEIVRQALRKYIAEYKELENIKGTIVATITALYEKRDKDEGLTHLQHEFGDIMTTYLHSHIAGTSCLEVMVVKGSSKRLKDLMDGLKANKHVRQLKFSIMTIE